MKKIVGRVIAVLFVLLFCQLPLFMEQYTMRLSGHAEESARTVREIEKNATATNKTVLEYVDKLRAVDDVDVKNSGILMQNQLERHQALTASFYAITNANAFTVPFVFLVNIYGDIFSETLGHFMPGFSFTLTSILYGVIGLLVWLGCSAAWARLFVKKEGPS